ncbi:MAG TPA: BatA domain-containing protein [Vicinamibacterales bacterium]|nr:BatA domain-containing protein [Vicinamibacterales bacterium]
MSFLTPLFLVGLAGIAIPVIIHLIQKERKDVVAFPSLMFLRRIPYQSVNRRRIRNWPLLLLRLAALALIVTAFARPFLRRDALAAAAAGGAREVVILLDRSYSLGYGDRWQRAVGAARQAIDGLRADDRATLALFDTGVEVALRSTSDKGRLGAALDGAQVSAAATKFGPALKLAGSIIGESGLPNKEVVLISDFQRLGWLGAEGVRLPDGTRVTPVSVADDQAANVAITPAVLQRTVVSGQERVTVTAGALNRGPSPVDVSLSLEVDGRVIESRPLKVDANGSSSATFAAFAPTAKFTRGTVRLGNDRLPRDNVFHFVVSPSQRVKLIIVDRPASSRAASLYLAQALALSESPGFDVVQRQMGNLTAEDISSAAVIVLNDVPVQQPLAGQLAAFVEAGGGLFAAFGERATWPAGAPAVMPATPAATADRTRGTPGRIGSVEYGHPVFESFRGPRSGDFSAARFYTYRQVTLEPGAQVLARYDDGAPALIERKAGNGRVLAWTSTLDVGWNDLALKPVFLPFIHRLGAALASYRQRPAFMTVGDVASAATAAGASAAPVVLTPAGQRLARDGDTGVLELEEQGFYEIRDGDRDAQPLTIAANVDLAESDLTPIDPQDVVAGATGLAGGAAPAGSNATITNEERERSQRVWWYLLFAGLLLLTGETVVANGIRTKYL